MSPLVKRGVEYGIKAFVLLLLFFLVVFTLGYLVYITHECLFYQPSVTRSPH